MSQADFDAFVFPFLVASWSSLMSLSLVASVKSATDEGIHPKMISKGSSGSYFARAKVEGRVQTVAYVLHVLVL
jgi:hypothetical protein